MDEAHNPEINREYRLIGQTLGMHAHLRDRLLLKARVADVLLLVCAVVFCATTFAEDELFQFLRLPADGSRVMLGIASIAAFGASMVALLVDWKGCAARHAEAARKWSDVLEKFREARSDDGSWAKADEQELGRQYWEASRNTVPIPDLKFNGLKARYLTKVRMSKLISKHPGCPRFFLWLLIRGTATVSAVGDLRRKGAELTNEKLRKPATEDKRTG